MKVVSISLVALALMLFAAEAAAQNTQKCIASSENALTLRKQGKLVAARKEFWACASQTCPPPIREECASRADEVDHILPTIVFEAKDGGGRDLSSVKVTVDGQPLADKLDGSALEVDPGDHTFTFEMAGQAPVTQHYVIAVGTKLRHERVTFGGMASPVVGQPTYGIASMGSGVLVVKADHPGTVFIDDANAGHTPLTLNTALAGRHRVRVEFDDGGSSATERVLVSSGETTEINATLSDAGMAFRYRDGARLGATIGVGVSNIAQPAFPIVVFVNVGLSPGVDVRIGPRFTPGLSSSTFSSPSGGDMTTFNFAYSVGLDANFRFNIGSIYTLALGLSGGYANPNNNNNGNGGGLCPCAGDGPELRLSISPLTLRFGENRQFEAGINTDVGLFVPSHSGATFGGDASLAFTWIAPKFFQRPRRCEIAPGRVDELLTRGATSVPRASGGRLVIVSCTTLVLLACTVASCAAHDGLAGGQEEVLLPYPPDGGVVAWDAWAGEFVRDYCVQCHSPTAPCGGSGCHAPGDPRIAPNFALKDDVVAEDETIRCGISVNQDPSWNCGGTAPKTFPIFLGQNALPTDAQRDLMVGWFDAGCP